MSEVFLLEKRPKLAIWAVHFLRSMQIHAKNLERILKKCDMGREKQPICKSRREEIQYLNRTASE